MKIMNLRFMGALVLLSALIISAISCNPDEKDELLGKGTNAIRFSNQTDPEDGFSLVAYNAVTETRTIISLNRDAISPSDLQTATSVDFAVDATVMTAYNTANGTNFIMLPAANYTLVGVTGSTFSFAAGEYAKEIQMTLNPTGLDYSKSYALPFALKNPAGGYAVGAGGSKVVIQIIVKNAYDGVYSMGGSMGRYDGTTGTALNDGLDGPMKAGLTTNISTAGANTDIFTMYWASGGGVGGVGLTASPRITINSNNTITLDIVDGGATPANWGPIPGMANNYDPATKTFNINWKWGAAVSGSPSGTTRAMYYKLTYSGPR